MEIILDVQGFRGPDNRFIVKKLASIAIQHDIDNIKELSYTLFQPPYHWKVLPTNYQRLNTCLIRNYHGIGWNAGTTSYNKLEEVLNYLTNNKKIIYVKGIEKKLWIQN
uniref:Uncharacterized protein n=1 Tax=Cotesia sesamiae Mombasa bracovirus TaxID=452649 RepID=R9XNI9_9VIRU|nr:hypothetical protein CsmBAC4b19.3 [Cotesia sesamiae Mombasa bracovirus]